MNIESLYKKALNSGGITRDDALLLLNVQSNELFYYADKLRSSFKGNKVKLCSIINARSGLCSEDCRFCAQSAKYQTGVSEYDLVGATELAEAAGNARSSKAGCFGIVTSGRKPGMKDIEKLVKLIPKNETFIPSASLGEASVEELIVLKRAGLRKYHHNLEASESFFPNICTTHSFADRARTIRNAKKAGLEVCAGGILGLGETAKDRIDLAFALKELDVDSVPLNFLNPIKGTPFENNKKLEPLEILCTISLFRFILAGRDIMICGGREVNLGDMQSRIFYAGANGMMVGGYLTSSSRPVELDHKMIKDLGFEIE